MPTIEAANQCLAREPSVAVKPESPRRFQRPRGLVISVWRAPANPAHSLVSDAGNKRTRARRKTRILRSTPGEEFSPLGERESGVLRVLEEESLTSFSFEGLKRRIGSHPQTLSRVLDRLEERSMVERMEDGYRVTERGREVLIVHPATISVEHLTILKTMMPPGSSLSGVLASLRGKWFGSLRWLGYSAGGDDLVMKWVTEDGKVQLDARFSAVDLTIDATLLRGRELAEAVSAAHALLAHITRSFAPRRRRALLFELTSAYSAPN